MREAGEKGSRGERGERGKKGRKGEWEKYLYEKRILWAVVEGGRMAEGLGGVTKEGGTARGRRGDEKDVKL